MKKTESREKWKKHVEKKGVSKEIIEKQELYLDKLEFLSEEADKRAEFFKDFLMPGFEEAEEIEEESTSSESGSNSEDGDSSYYDFNYETGWLGTLYAPTLGGINSQGDPTVTATGVKVKNYRTIAVDPTVIPYGSFVGIKVKGHPKLTKIWHAEDTGGAIKGKHIDLCVEASYLTNKSYKGPIEVAVIKKGNNAQTARDNEKSGIDKIIKEIESGAKKIGGGSEGVKAKGAAKKACMAAIQKTKEKTTYSQANRKNWEGNVFDCSSFCNYVYQEAGVYIMGKSNGRNGNTQTIKNSSMKKIKDKDLKAGDLVFMNNYGHVGIYVGNNKWIGCQSGGDAVSYREMNTPYFTWGCTHRRPV